MGKIGPDRKFTVRSTVRKIFNSGLRSGPGLDRKFYGPDRPDRFKLKKKQFGTLDRVPIDFGLFVTLFNVTLIYIHNFTPVSRRAAVQPFSSSPVASRSSPAVPPQARLLESRQSPLSPLPQSPFSSRLASRKSRLASRLSILESRQSLLSPLRHILFRSSPLPVITRLLFRSSLSSESSSLSMFLSRVLRRTLLAPARLDTAAAAFSTNGTSSNPLEQFFEIDRNPDDEKPVVYGRGWKASELRFKSWDDLNKLWYVLLKERNMLMTQKQMLNAQNLRFPNPERISKVKKSMCRIKHVLTERAIEDSDPRRCAEMKRMINSL